jgi:hypothetical protein
MMLEPRSSGQGCVPRRVLNITRQAESKRCRSKSLRLCDASRLEPPIWPISKAILRIAVRIAPIRSTSAGTDGKSPLSAVQFSDYPIAVCLKDFWPDIALSGLLQQIDLACIPKIDKESISRREATSAPGMYPTRMSNIRGMNNVPMFQVCSAIGHRPTFRAEVSRPAVITVSPALFAHRARS